MIRKAQRIQRQESDPTPAEIRRRTQAIRSGWSDHELSRRSGIKPVSWMPPVLPATDMPEWGPEMGADAVV